VGLESARESVHVFVGDPLRIRLAQVAEDLGPAELGGDVSVAGHDVEVQVSEALGFGEQDRVGLGAAHDVNEGLGQPLLEDPEACSLVVGELGQAGEMPDGEQDEPAEQRAVESVRNLPPTVGVNAITGRQVTPVGELAGVTAGGHKPTGRNLAHGPVRKAVTAARLIGPLSPDWVEWPEPGSRRGGPVERERPPAEPTAAG
jgi:hypothetical protein